MDKVTKIDDRLTRQLRRFYAHGAFEPPPDGFSDAVHTDVTLRFGWVDRFKVLFGHDLHLRLHTWTENLVGEVRAEEPRVHLFFPWRLRKPAVGVVTLEEGDRHANPT